MQGISVLGLLRVARHVHAGLMCRTASPAPSSGQYVWHVSPRVSPHVAAMYAGQAKCRTSTAHLYSLRPTVMPDFLSTALYTLLMWPAYSLVRRSNACKDLQGT
jgi:hypothetical protein